MTEPTSRVVRFDGPPPPPKRRKPRRLKINLAKLAKANTAAMAEAMTAATPALKAPAGSSTNGQYPKCGRCGGRHGGSHDCFGLPSLTASAAPAPPGSYHEFCVSGFRWSG